MPYMPTMAAAPTSSSAAPASSSAAPAAAPFTMPMNYPMYPYGTYMPGAYGLPF